MLRDRLSVWVGWDPRESAAFAVTRHSVLRHSGQIIPIRGLVLDQLRERGEYTRPTEIRDGLMYDVISEHPMSTEFACSRFLVPFLAKRGWALFMDCDMMVRRPLNNLFEQIDKEHGDKAVVCVKHQHEPTETKKMDGQVQSQYARKNWSSFMFFNCEHEANRSLIDSTSMANSLPGRDLHRFCWLKDDDIGEIGPEWNYLVGYTDPAIDAANVHWTDGVPSMPGHEDAEYANEYWRTLATWAEAAISDSGQ